MHALIRSLSALVLICGCASPGSEIAGRQVEFPPGTRGVAGGREPAYQGRPFSEWVSQLDHHAIWAVGSEPPEVVAIRSIGTNALPILLEWLAEKDPPNTSCLNPSRGMRAERAFDILGEVARPAIPELTSLALTLPELQQYDRCIGALASMGSHSLPSLIKVLTNGSPGRRFSAIGYLPVLQTNAAVAVPAVIQCLTGNDDHLGWKAADELSRLDVPRSVLLPSLTNALRSPSSRARVRILRCLLWIGPDARPTLPAVRRALTDSDPDVREAAAQAVEEITRDAPIKTQAR